MKNKICLITGANSGIGFELAKGMAQRNYETIMLCRNIKSGESARNKIIISTQNTAVHLMIADLSSQSSIREFVTQFNAQYPHLDVLFNNAGANFFNRQLTEDGIEMTFAVNYLAPFLLTNLLLPKLKQSPSARIITTVGGYDKKTTINFNDINFESNFNVIKASGQAILAKLLFTDELSRILSESNITANCFHPGAVKTNLQKKMPIMWRVFVGVMRPFFASAAKGAKAGVYLATSKDVEKSNGRFFKKYKETTLPLPEDSSELAKTLWKFSENLTQIKQSMAKI